MRDVLADAAFGTVMVATGVLIVWFAARLSSPVMGVLGAVFAVLGVLSAGLQVTDTDEAAEPEPPEEDGVPGVSLSSAPECVREDVPPSSKLVWMYLAAEGESTLDDVVSGTQLTTRTTRNAITRLEKSGVITKRPADCGFGAVYYDVTAPDPTASSDADEEERPSPG